MVLNHYQIIGIPEDAYARQIKAAYRSLAKRCHPDTNHGSEAAAELFRQINEAYRVLGDERLRKAYDLKLSAQRTPLKQESAKPKTRPKAAKPDPQQKFNNFLYSMLGALLETPDDPTELKPCNNASPTAPQTRKVRSKPDFNFYY
ncbi:J domain-containing protein [Malonomonas rubra]|uniref:J domain-containing protein n=1 Tax=Malonomonas rubra TaxID=57040 RepID=UPI0026E9E09C|nr:J domain-containing protein [Malonomonas rubra]